METFEIRNLSFSYPEQKDKALDSFSLSVKQGEFLVLCGPSGCGKSSLLRQLKPILTPHGRREGEIFFENRLLWELNSEEQSRKIGFVLQSPENQIVTDKVWHELAFGLESLGYNTPTIRRRVAEMASFFGIESWFYKDVTELSGGQKQLLNLASIMAMQPSVLILDEPTSQLDPIAASDFLATLGRINRELGTTVILTEHRLEEAFPLANRVAVMDKGRLLCVGTPDEVGRELRSLGHGMFLAMPAAMRIWAAVDNELDCPVSVRDGRNWLSEYAETKSLNEVLPEPEYRRGEEVLKADGLWFRYEKDSPDVVKGLDLCLHKGEFLALLGGNGAGKSTALKLLSGLKKPYRGDVERRGTIALLPQNPQTLFVKKTVREDLFEMLRGRGIEKSQQEAKVARAVRLCRLEELTERHPYDLSGGEQQRAALAKVLLVEPEILLMDEPTKGLDAEFKESLSEILRVLIAAGVGIIMVSHDVEFCAMHAHRCALFFDGNVVTHSSPREFFSGNSFYTTSANRMARSILPDAVTVNDVISACGGKLPPKAELPEDGYVLPEPDGDDDSAPPKRLSWWRKIGAVVSGVTSLAFFLYFVSQSSLSELVSEGGMTALASEKIWMYAGLIISLLAFALFISRRSHRADYLIQTPLEKRKLSKRTILATVLILLFIPLTLFIGVHYLNGRKYYFIALLIILETMLPFFLIFEGRKPQARELVIIAVLCAISVAGRAALFMLPEFKPVWALTIIAGVAFGGETGFLVGAVTMLVSNVMFSQGPWTPWQMFAMGIIGFLAGVLFRKGILRRSRVALCSFGAISCFLIYGGILNPASALMASAEISWGALLSYYITGFPVDCVHAVATWLFLWFGAEPMLEKLDRVKVKYGLVS